MKINIGIDIGGTAVKLGMIDAEGNILDSFQVPTLADTNSLDTIIENMINAISELIERNKDKKVKAIGIGAPGNISPEEGKIVSGIANIPVLNGYSLAHVIQKHFKLPTYIDNDANNAGQGEFLFGAGKKYKDFIMITLGTGIGGAIFIDGKLYSGAKNFSGEVGHMVIHADGRQWNSGISGCWEAYGSATAMINMAKQSVEQGLDTELRKYYPDNLNAKVIVEEAHKGDYMAKEIVREIAKYVGIGVANLINIFNPEAIIIGGGLSQAGDILMEKIKHSARVYSRTQAWESVKIISAKLGNQAGILGSAALAFMKSKESE